MANIIKLELEIDIDELKETINNAVDLNDNEEVFNSLVQFARAKKQINALYDELIGIEDTAKSLIKSKASALYGNNWQAIKGRGYKISRSQTGPVFNIDGKPPKQFVVIKESLDSKLVENYIKETGKLPKGISYNPSRGSSLRITVDENN